MPTQEEIQRLKDNWVDDPCWDIEYTEGFEEHKDELREYRERKEAEWTRAYEEKVEARAQELECSPEMAQYVMQLEQRLANLDAALETVYFSSHSHPERRETISAYMPDL